MTDQKKHISIKYNTYTYQTTIENILYEKGAKQCKNLIIENNCSYRIADWFTEFLNKIDEDLRDDFTINFESTEIDIEVVREIINDYNLKGESKFLFNPKITLIKDPLDDIKEVIQILKNSSNEEVQTALKSNEYKSIFSQINENRVTIALIATVSAGKSTLLNTFIGNDLLPSKNQACTATICEIKNTNSDVYIGEVVNEKSEVIQEQGIVNAKIISELNEKGNNEFLKINIEGAVKNISAKGMDLVLIDTPGPNNSGNEMHKEITYTLIKDTSRNPLILFVLNAQNLETNDDKDLLTELAKTLNSDKNNVSGRILFVLNKIDELNPEKEDIERVMTDCKDYLARNKISNPKIFPISSQLANLSLKQTESLSRNDKDTLVNKRRRILPDLADNYLGIDTIKHAPIPKNIKDKLYEEALNCSEKASLHYSGFTALQCYLEQYIEHNHKITLIHDLLEKITPLLNEVISQNKLKLNSTAEEIKTQKEELTLFEKFLDNNFTEQKNNLSETINKLTFDDSFFFQLKQKTGKDFLEINKVLNSNKIKKDTFISIKRKSEDIFSNLRISLKTSIKADCEYAINEATKKINTIIKNSFSSLIKDAQLSENNSSNFINEINLLINQQKYEKHIAEVKGFKDDSSIWYRWFGWGTEIKAPIYQNVIYVDGIEFYNKEFAPLRNKTLQDLNDSESFFKDKIEQIKREGLIIVSDIGEKHDEKRKLYQEKLNASQISNETRIKIETELNDLNSCKNIILTIQAI